MLEKLRAKPDHVKKSISLVFTIVVFGGILFVWLSSWDAQQTETDVREKTASPVSSFTTMIDGLVSSVRDAISGAPTVFETLGKSATSTTAGSATSTNNIDLSGIVIIDAATSSPQ